MSLEKNLNVGVISSDRDGEITVIDSKQNTLDKNVVLPEKEEKEIDSKESDGMIV